MVERVFLNALIELEGHIECLMVASGTSIFRQTIDHEANGIELFFGVAWLAEIIEAPIGSTILGVDEMVEDVILGTRGSFEVFRLAEYAIGCRESPEDAGIQDGTLVGGLHQLAASGHLAVEASVLMVLHLVEPEAENVVLQHVENFTSEGCDGIAMC